jgi:alpha-1,6-mannosyltransferase
VAAAAVGRLFYRLQRGYDTTIVTSQTMQTHLAARGVTRLARVPLGVDPIFFNATVAATKPARRRLLFVGRLIADKAADLLWRALPEILAAGDVEVTVLGSGPYQPKFAAASWPGYRYLEYVSGRQELAEIYRQHDILLAPGPYETFGLAVLEAMAGGLVVVGPNRGGTAELLAAAGSPFVFNAGDTADFVRVVAQATRADLEPHRRASLAAARRYGTWDEAIGRLIAVYEDQQDRSRPLALPMRSEPAGGRLERRLENKVGPRRAA